MARTFLELVQAACDEIGVPRPSSIIGNNDETSRQLISLANREGKEFSALANSRGGWSDLHKEYVFVTEVLDAQTCNTTSGSPVITGLSDTSSIEVDTYFASGTGIPYEAKVKEINSATQVTLDRPCTATGSGVSIVFARGGYQLPGDFEFFANRTFYDGSMRWELLGPISASEKQVLRYGSQMSGPRRKFYVRGGNIYINPVPSTDGEVIAFDYYSNYWCESSSGVAQPRWAADTDLYILDEDAFIKGLKWRYLRAKGMDYSQELTDYNSDSLTIIARDGGARNLRLNASCEDIFLISSANVPDTGYGD